MRCVDFTFNPWYLTIFQCFQSSAPFKLEMILFQFIWTKRAPLVRRDICQLQPFEGGQGVPKVETRHHILRLSFLGRMCSQDDETGAFLKEDARLSFPLTILAQKRVSLVSRVSVCSKSSLSVADRSYIVC